MQWGKLQQTIKSRWYLFIRRHAIVWHNGRTGKGRVSDRCYLYFTAYRCCRRERKSMN